jgi:hypothetical protein
VKRNEGGGSQSKNGRGEKRVQNCFRKNVKELDSLEDVGVDWRTIIKWILKKYSVRLLSGFIGLRIGASGGLL